MIRSIGTILLALLLLNCEQDEAVSTGKKCFQLPTGTHLPRFTQDDNDALWLSYVRSVPASDDTLLLTRIDAAGVKTSKPIANGADWFVNWADFPSVSFVEPGLHGNIFFYHFLQYSSTGTYDYDIRFDLFDDNGLFYGKQKLHQDTVAAEHGFLSSAQLPEGDLQVTWLDGRYTKLGAAAGAEKGTEEQAGHGHSGGAMTLRTKALFDSTSVELDHRVCDCCNTATAATDSLIMVAYRDRSEHEIRDIAYVTKPTTGGNWSTPKLVHADNWEISGCPVNGPALAANGAGHIAAVWYTAPAGRAQVLFSRYDASTDTWASPTLLNDDSPLGRVDLQLADDGTAYVTSITQGEPPERTLLTLWAIDLQGTIIEKPLAQASPARSSGFPKTALFQDKLYWARTVVGAKKGEQYVEVCWR